MNYKVKIDPIARIDILESVLWYNKQQPDLGRYYYNSVQQTIKSIKANPNKYQLRYKTLRMALVNKFPFIVMFLIDENKKQIAITAVLHTSRNPEIWNQRTQ
jgi:plasmid stabilization system protein ParE